MKLLEIGIYPQDHNNIKGGVMATVYGLAKQLAQNPDNTIRVISLPYDKHDQANTPQQQRVSNNLTVCHIPLKYNHQLGGLLQIRQIIKQIKSYQADVCHIHGSVFVAYVVAWYIKLIANTPAMFSIHGIINIELKRLWQDHQRSYGQRCKNFIQWLIYAPAEALTCYLYKNHLHVGTPYVAKQLKRDCFILPQGINQPEFTNVKASFGANFISIGVIHQRKGHHLLIAAFKILQQQLPQATLTIIGNKTDATYLEKLLAMCQGNAGITIKVNASRQEIITALGQASIFVLHSYEESQGISLCEAMACGLPVVATNIGGIPFVIGHQQQGLLSAYGDVDSFANNMMRLANDQSLWQSYHNSCLVKANDFYWQNINDKMQQRLTQL